MKSKVVILSLCILPRVSFSQAPQLILEQRFEAVVNDSSIQAYSGGVPELYWPRLTTADIDGDGILELIIGNSSGRLMLYRYTGNGFHAIFHLEDSFYDSLDVGVNAAPCFFDINNDGDLDLFVSNGSNGGYGGNVSYFENIGDPFNADWLLREDTLAGLDAWDHGVVTIGDIDNDGDGDMIVGGGYGRLYFSENIGTPDSAIWAAPVSSYAGIDVGYKATPHLCDIDCDGKLDLIIGCDRGKVYFYKNNGLMEGEVQWEFITGTLTGVDFTHLDYTHPICADIDGDGDLDILVSEHYGNINFFENTGGCEPEWSWVTGDLLSGTIDVGRNAFPALADMDGDGDLDMVIGKANGQLRLYLNTGTAAIPEWQLITEYFTASDFGRYSKPFFEDYDLDGDSDLFVTSSFGRVQCFENRTDSGILNFELLTNDFFPGFQFYNSIPLLGDFNKNTLMDFAFPILNSSSSNDSIVIVYNTGLMEPWAEAISDTIFAGQIYRAHTLDYNHNGNIDFILHGDNSMPGFWLLSNTSEDSVWVMENLSTTNHPLDYSSTFADLSGNSCWDYITGDSYGGINYWVNTSSDCMNICPEHIVENGSAIPAGIYQASGNISASSILLDSTQVIFSAGDTITLLPGFYVPLGAEFLGIMEGCLPE